MSLFDEKAMEHSAACVRKELDRLLDRAAECRKRVADAAGKPSEPAVRLLMELELQHVARALTRAQAVLVHRSDPRYGAAKAVIRYCDEADAAGAQDGHSIRVGA